jgi:hypothetical protein
MLSKAQLDEIIDHTGSVIYIRQDLLARAQKQREVAALVRQRALSVIKELGNEVDRERNATGTPVVD